MMSPRGRLRAVLATGDRGFSLVEILVGITISGLMSVGIVSAIFTTNDLSRRADERNTVASGFSIIALLFDRDGSMACGAAAGSCPSVATAKSQTTQVACSTTMDLGVQESGASIRFQTSAHGGTTGPLWFERVSGAGTRTVLKNVSACTWQTVQDAGGKWMLKLDITYTGTTGETATQTFRVVPRLW
jgi:prepilin-type N-terminal cleavage/methylation domain-containing protein